MLLDDCGTRRWGCNHRLVQAENFTVALPEVPATKALQTVVNDSTTCLQYYALMMQARVLKVLHVGSCSRTSGWGVVFGSFPN